MEKLYLCQLYIIKSQIWTEILPCWTVETICPSVYEIIGTTAVPSDALMFCRNDFNKETCISSLVKRLKKVCTITVISNL
jgi:hypothetical protein